MSTRLTRRSLATGIGAASLGVGGLVSVAPNASADTPFTSFAFRATGEPAARTMPDRLAEIKNVKDFGAAGDGVTDDTVAIQNAVNWTSGANRGTIYFPCGRYLVSQPITFNYNGNLDICFRGESSGSFIVGNVNGYIFDRALATPNNTTGARIFEKLAIQNGNGAPNTGAIRVGSSQGVYIRDCILRGYQCVTTEDSVGSSSQNVLLQNVIFNGAQLSGCGGVVVGGSGAMLGCRFVSCDVAVRMYGNGFNISGNRIERCNTAYLLGLDSGGNNVGASGFSLTGGTTEGNWISIDFGGSCSGFVISSFSMLGHDLTNAGMTPNIQDTQYGIFVRANNARAGMISGVTISSVAAVAGIEIDAASTRADLLVVGADSAIMKGANWVLPANSYTAQFQNCNIQPVWKYSQLPTGGNVLEGDQFNVSDVNGTWGTAYAGGGGTHGLVRWNGSNWTVMG
jgi:hypothetical protein